MGSTLTWRTFRLGVIGLVLACAHAAQGGPSPRAQAALLRVQHAAGVERASPTEWRGVGPVRNASAASVGERASRNDELVVADPAGPFARPARTERERAMEQARLVKASMQAASAAPAPAPASRSRDPRVDRALSRMASGRTIDRDAFGR